MIDAETYHSPASAPGLVEAATDAVGTQRELARRLGVTPRYLQLLASGKGSMSYPLQYCLECIANQQVDKPQTNG